MPHTSDNDKKAKDNNALRHEKNMMVEKNRKAGKNQYSKKTDHLIMKKTCGGRISRPLFNFIQQKSPTAISGARRIQILLIQWGFKPRGMKLKHSGGDIRF